MRTTAYSFLDDAGQEQVESAVADAEEVTAAEFVCAVATESGRYDRAESLVGFLLALLLLTLANLLTWQFAPTGDWGQPAATPLLVQLLTLVVGFVVGSTLASYWHGLRRLAVPAKQMAAETTRSAAQVFSSQGIGRTSGRAGVLIYVTLFERTVVILADQAAYDALGDEQLSELRDQALVRLREGDPVGAFVVVVTAATERLKSSLPRQAPGDEGLSNSLLRIHPRP